MNGPTVYTKRHCAYAVCCASMYVGIMYVGLYYVCGHMCVYDTVLSVLIKYEKEQNKLLPTFNAESPIPSFFTIY
jgi:hypothetical protein